LTCVLLGATDEVILFFEDRLRGLLADENVRHDCIDAILDDASARAVAYRTSFIPNKIVLQAKKLQEWLATDEGSATLTTIKRTLKCAD